MKRVCVIGLLCLLLSGCTATAWETVEDETPAVTVSSWLEDAYSVRFGVPASAVLLEEREGWQVYGTEDGSLEIETRTFLASGPESAAKTVSGFDASELTILQTSRFGLPEYQFAWVSQTEQGSRLYRADLVLDGVDCYAVICSRPEDAGSAADDEIRQVFASFGLDIDEGV